MKIPRLTAHRSLPSSLKPYHGTAADAAGDAEVRPMATTTRIYYCDAETQNCTTEVTNLRNLVNSLNAPNTQKKTQGRDLAANDLASASLSGLGNYCRVTYDNTSNDLLQIACKDGPNGAESEYYPSVMPRF